jgi:hypothetical protein
MQLIGYRRLGEREGVCAVFPGRGTVGVGFLVEGRIDASDAETAPPSDRRAMRSSGSSPRNESPRNSRAQPMRLPGNSPLG